MIDAPSRSAFVTTIAWLSIVLGGFATVIAGMQNVILYFMFPRAEMKQAIATAPSSYEMPASAKILFANVELFLGVFFLLSIIMLVVGVGLLKRKNWARVAFIGLMLFSIVWNVGGLFLQEAFMSQLMQAIGAPADSLEQFRATHTILRAIGAVFAIGFSVICGWTIWRLRPAAVAAEFGMPSR